MGIGLYWSTADIADAVAAGLARRAEADDLEQAVYGFDTLAELALHPLIECGLRDAPQAWGVWREQRYPRNPDQPRRRKKSEGRRCDFVLTPDARPLLDPDAADTLFGQDDQTTPPEQAYWLEVKAVAQFEPTGPFGRYSAELLSPVPADVRKLWQNAAIFHAGLLLVLFTADQATADHDLAAWHDGSLSRGYPVSLPATRSIAITDRIGNSRCTVAVFSVRGG